MAKSAERNFVLQQGFEDAAPLSCGEKYGALMFQPRLIGVLVLIGLLTQAWPLFLALSAVLWWNVLVPKLNPFDALFNSLVARPGARERLTPAPAPRRFAQRMAASFMLGIGWSFWAGYQAVAWTLAALLAIALAALILGGFCLGSYVYHVIRGQARFANRTLPWARSTEG